MDRIYSLRLRQIASSTWTIAICVTTIERWFLFLHGMHDTKPSVLCHATEPIPVACLQHPMFFDVVSNIFQHLSCLGTNENVKPYFSVSLADFPWGIRSTFTNIMVDKQTGWTMSHHANAVLKEAQRHKVLLVRKRLHSLQFL